jgi:hypothetical protein
MPDGFGISPVFDQWLRIRNKEFPMDYDTEKVDETVLAPLWLTCHDVTEYGARAWKGHDWDVLDRLHEKGYLGDPKSKAKSVVVTPQGLARSRELFHKLFAKKA